MKLQELAAPKPSKQIAKVFESYFGSRIKFDRLNSRQTRIMLNKVRGVLGEHRSTTARHTSEQNPYDCLINHPVLVRYQCELLYLFSERFGLKPELPPVNAVLILASHPLVLSPN